MSDEEIRLTKHKNWDTSECELYDGCLVRVLGETDSLGQVLIELMSGPRNGCRIWMLPDLLQRKETST